MQTNKRFSLVFAAFVVSSNQTDMIAILYFPKSPNHSLKTAAPPPEPGSAGGLVLLKAGFLFPASEGAAHRLLEVFS